MNAGFQENSYHVSWLSASTHNACFALLRGPGEVDHIFSPLGPLPPREPSPTPHSRKDRVKQWVSPWAPRRGMGPGLLLISSEVENYFCIRGPKSDWNPPHPRFGSLSVFVSCVIER